MLRSMGSVCQCMEGGRTSDSKAPSSSLWECRKLQLVACTQQDRDLHTSMHNPRMTVHETHLLHA